MLLVTLKNMCATHTERGGKTKKVLGRAGMPHILDPRIEEGTPIDVVGTYSYGTW